MNVKSPQIIAVVSLIMLSALSRIFPHFLNFSPLCAISMFGAATFSSKKWAYLTPLLAAWFSDLIINNFIYTEYFPKFTWFYAGFWWQYAPYVLITLLSTWWLKNISVGKLVVGALGSSLLFFLISNFGCWVNSTETEYAKNFSGLVTCYEAGLPFLKGTLTGTAVYTILLFGAYNLFKNYFDKPASINSK